MELFLFQYSINFSSLKFLRSPKNWNLTKENPLEDIFAFARRHSNHLQRAETGKQNNGMPQKGWN